MYNILCVSLSLMPDKSSKIVQSMWIQFLHDLHKCGEYSRGSTVLTFLFREICKAIDIDVYGMCGCVILLQALGFT